MADMILHRGACFRLFVYGTLMRGGRLNVGLRDQEFLGPVVTRPLYGLLDLGAYPGLVRRQPDGAAIEGELYRVSAERLGWLDAVEGAPDLFRLESVELEGDYYPSFAYFYQRDPGSAGWYAGRRWEQRPRGIRK
jgi:gamma-glutamylcyclotransferase (GGCT)/AIG2-like uncharacterized protein YtfP